MLLLPPTADSPFDIGSTDDSLERMAARLARYGDTYRVRTPERASYTYVIHHPDDVQRVLASNHHNYTKGVGLDRVKILLGNGSMTSEGELWRRQRRMLQPLFHRRVVAQFARTIGDANDRLIDRWSAPAARGDSIDVTHEMSKLAADVILRAMFGEDFDGFSDGSGGSPFDLITADRARTLDFAYRLRSLMTRVAGLVQRRRTEGQGIDRADFLGMLMAARDEATGDPMSDRQLLDEVLTIIVAGHETTASALNWTWLLLSRDEEVERRLHAEIDALPRDSAPALTQLETLVYAPQILKEVLRLYPPGWLLSRRAIGADALGGFDVPAGTDVLIPLYLIHRDPRFWQDPEVFRPERFSPAVEATRPRFAFVPFAAGARHCLGETFAWYEMLMHLVAVARRYRLLYSRDRPVELEARINLRTRSPLRMQLALRE